MIDRTIDRKLRHDLEDRATPDLWPRVQESLQSKSTSKSKFVLLAFTALALVALVVVGAPAAIAHVPAGTPIIGMSVKGNSIQGIPGPSFRAATPVGVPEGLSQKSYVYLRGSGNPIAVYQHTDQAPSIDALVAAETKRLYADGRPAYLYVFSSPNGSEYLEIIEQPSNGAPLPVGKSVGINGGTGVLVPKGEGVELTFRSHRTQVIVDGSSSSEVVEIANNLQWQQ